MKLIKNTQEIIKARDLKKMIELRLYAEKKEAELKEHFRNLLKKEQEDVLNINNTFIISLEQRIRKDLDKEKLNDFFGGDMKEFERLTDYNIFQITESKSSKIS